METLECQLASVPLRITSCIYTTVNFMLHDTV